MTAAPLPPTDPETGSTAGAEAASAPPSRDRGISPVAGNFGGRHSRMISLAALAAGCGVFLFATWDRGEAGSDRSSDEAAPPRQAAPFEPARRPEPPRLDAASVDPLAPSLTGDVDPPPALNSAANTGGAQSTGPSAAEQRRALAESARRAPLMAFSRSGGAAIGAPPSPSPDAAPTRDAETANPLDQLRALSPIGVARAGRLTDRNFLITAGVSVPCVLQTAMDSTTPGYVSCLVSRDVWSDNGAVVLMERGTRVLGEYRGGLQQGRGRLFVLWTRAVTPQGVAVALASPAADALGRPGIDGAIDSHFWDRFGGGLLLSIVDDGLQAAVGRGDAFASTARAPSDAAAIALEGSIGIPPTLRRPQGGEVSIFVAQDLSFAEVYRLRTR